jgi:hypothetical protein
VLAKYIRICTFRWQHNTPKFRPQQNGCSTEVSLTAGKLVQNILSLYNHLNFFDNIRVVEVEVRLFGVKLVQVVLLSLIVPCPCRAPKYALLSDTQQLLYKMRKYICAL